MQSRQVKYHYGCDFVTDPHIFVRYFIGTRESTFTFRIQEEREMMGFRLEDTFDMLCGDGDLSCESGTRWNIDWGEGKDWSLPQSSNDRSEL